LSTTPVRPLLAAREVARLLSASPKTVYRLASGGELRYVRVRGLLRFEPDAVERFIETHRRVEAEEAA
jgi:excisionase family DNA binding protein